MNCVLLSTLNSQLFHVNFPFGGLQFLLTFVYLLKFSYYLAILRLILIINRLSEKLYDHGLRAGTNCKDNFYNNN